ncbi:MAG: hypothetical protein KC547_10750 [Anaerolineae bacterium]|nr:hypothetical protein [Anaerolineae bacterium]MCA9907281.1 hypothetical protein [Anaerolineae bacterium]
MPIRTTWYDPEETIRYWKFDDDWDWGQFFLTLEESSQAVESRPGRVDTILDLRDTHLKVGGLVDNFRKSLRIHARNVQLAVVVGGPFIRAVWAVLSPFWDGANERYIYAPSLDAALTIIRHSRQAAATQPSEEAGR